MFLIPVGIALALQDYPPIWMISLVHIRHMIIQIESLNTGRNYMDILAWINIGLPCFFSLQPILPDGKSGFNHYLSGFTTGLNDMKNLIHLRLVISNLIAAGWLNKYSVSAGLFVIWMIFFDKHNFFTQWSLRSSVHQMESSITNYQNQLAKAEEEHQDLMNNKEKFAREKYLMHRPDEDVFIFQ